MTRRSIRTQRAKQQLSSARLPTGYQVSELIGKHLSRMPYHPEVTQRMVQEEKDSLLRKEQSKRKKKKTHKKKKQKKKKKKEKKKKKLIK